MPTEMELTLEQTQQGVSYEVSYDESNTYVLERFNTTAGNPVKKILLKLNLSDHRLCKMVVEGLEYGRYGLEYGVLPSSGYSVLDLVSFVVFGDYGHRYVVERSGVSECSNENGGSSKATCLEPRDRQVYPNVSLFPCFSKGKIHLNASTKQFQTCSNPRNQATIQDGRVTVELVQGRQTQSYVGTRNRGIATTSKGNYATGQPRFVKCYNCLGEGHMARQCTLPKRPRNAAWFKEKLMLAEA
ncbi:retrovirus-related pol polyprotein from transposon TNT 1-94 [Tanacetum coccineum]